jgi:hypothetical protein
MMRSQTAREVPLQARILHIQDRHWQLEAWDQRRTEHRPSMRNPSCPMPYRSPTVNANTAFYTKNREEENLTSPFSTFI